MSLQDKQHKEFFQLASLFSPCDLTIYYMGPSLEQGPLPALFYFALSANESLMLDPINQPAVLLAGSSIRVYSFTLPGHGPKDDKTKAIAFWAEQLHKDPQFLDVFINKCLENINFLIDEGYVDSDRMVVAGLSRGGYIAARVAASHPKIKMILGFAPLTELRRLDTFKDLLAVNALNLTEEVNHLYDKNIRFYIGNRDLIVGTDRCFHLMQVLVEYAYEQGIRSPSIDLIISPSIGHRGHGTPTTIFHDGINWIKHQLGLTSESSYG